MSTSTRWKRFAFFERKNLSLPPLAVRDLIPATRGGVGGGIRKGGGKTNFVVVDDDDDGGDGGGGRDKIDNDDPLDPKFLYRRRFDHDVDDGDYDDGDGDDDDHGLLLNDEECDAIGCGEYFSLVAASDVALPAKYYDNDDREVDADYYEAAGRMKSRPAVGGMGGGMDDDGGGIGTSAMGAGLVALRAAARDATMMRSAGRGGGGMLTTRGDGGGDIGTLQLLFASSRNTSHVHCIDVTARCTPINALPVANDGRDGANVPVRGGAGYSDDDANNNVNDRGGIDGDAFVISDERDIVVRKKMQQQLQRQQRARGGGKTNTTNDNNKTNVEAHDGWRGRYDPFASCDIYVNGAAVAASTVVVGGGSANATSSSTTTTTTTTPASRPTTTTTTKTKSTSPTRAGAAGRTKASSSSSAAAERRILDEHLGIFGRDATTNNHANATSTMSSSSSSSSSLFASSPFANEYRPDTARARRQNARPREMARIVGLASATCTVHYRSKSSLTSSSSSSTQPPAEEGERPRSFPYRHRHLSSASSSILFVAAITDKLDTAGVVVHANPHLMLSPFSLESPPCPATATSTVDDPALGGGMSRSWWCHRPSTYDFANHGRPACVTVLPGVACVGTDAGVILVYVFPIDRANGCGADGNHNNCGRMTLVAEIPAPRCFGDAIVGDGRRTTNMHVVSSVHLIGPSASPSFIVADGRCTTSATTGGGAANAGGGDNNGIHRLFVTYRKRIVHSRTAHVREGGASTSSSPSPDIETPSPSTSAGGVCCYDLGGLRIPGNSPTAASSGAGSHDPPVVSARYDMDGRDVATSCVCDGIDSPPGPVWSTSGNDANGASGEDATNSNSAAMEKMLPRYAVARNDGLHLYSHDERVGVCPIDGKKIAICSLPPPPVIHLRRPLRRAPTTFPPSDEKNGAGSSPASSSGGPNNDWSVHGAGATYTLVASTDFKSGRDAVDVYDTTNKLVGFHVLLSPGHRALRAVGVFSSPVVGSNALLCGGRSSAVVLTSGGSIVTLTERATPEKIDLLLQKNLFPTAISMAFSDPQFFRAEDIVKLYRRYAEHLYKKGDYSAAMDQYILTIGSLESSHVIFRFLDAPKIYLAVRYLVGLRAAGLATSVHEDLLRTCYLKLGDIDAASKIILTPSSSLSPPCDATASFLVNPNEAMSVPISRNLLACVDDPSEMLSAICSLNSAEAAEALVAHGVSIARSLPRETAGVVIALCEGSYSPSVVDDTAGTRNRVENTGSNLKCDKYPMSLFANAFMENPKLLRLILSHCRRNGNSLTPMLRRSLLELTLDEWNSAKRIGDVHVQKLRHDEAIMVCIILLVTCVPQPVVANSALSQFLVCT
jgi:hypothetical protein